MYLANPLKHADANAALYRLPATAMDALSVGRVAGPALRVGEVAVAVALQVPGMVLSHEAGHARQAELFGWSPTIRMTGWMSGSTEIDHTSPTAAPNTSRRDLLLVSAGPNQATIDSLASMDDWAVSGAIGTNDAIAHFLSRTNLSFYSTATLLHERTNTDPARYVMQLNRQGIACSQKSLATLATLSDALSAPTWAALASPLRFIATGDRRTQIPSVHFGQVRMTLPNFRVLLTEEGPTFGGSTIVSAEETNLKLSADAAVGSKSFALGAALVDFPLLSGATTVSLESNLSYSERSGLGAHLAIASEVPLSRNLSVGVTAHWASDFLLSDALSISAVGALTSVRLAL